MDPIIQTALISAGTSFATALATKGKGGPIQTMDDLWELAFGSFHLFVEKKRAIREKDLSDFKNKIASEINKIPAENIEEPPLNILGPALEASKFFIEDEVIRDMFSKIIASSMDNRKSNQVHSSYVEIIKQLSPLDAQNLDILKRSSEPIVQYRLQNIENNKDYKVIRTNVFLSNNKTQNIDLNAISLSNLTRLGLAEIIYDSYIKDLSLYSVFNDTEEYKELSLTALRFQGAYKESIKNENFAQGLKRQLGENEESIKYHRLKIKKGLIDLTPLGKSFVTICCA